MSSILPAGTPVRMVEVSRWEGNPIGGGTYVPWKVGVFHGFYNSGVEGPDYFSPHISAVVEMSDGTVLDVEVHRIRFIELHPAFLPK